MSFSGHLQLVRQRLGRIEDISEVGFTRGKEALGGKKEVII
jgi:hypothetical protein